MDTDNGDPMSRVSKPSKAQAPPPPSNHPTIRTIVEKIIKPATSETGLGYAITLNQDEPLTAQTVVSHAWDLPLDELIDT